MASKFAQSGPPSASPNLPDPSLQVHLTGATAGVQRYRGNAVGQSDVESIFGRPWSIQTSSHFHLILSYNDYIHSIFPNFWSHSLWPQYCGSTQLDGSSRPGTIIPFHLIPALFEPKVLFCIKSEWLLREVQRCVDGGLSASQLHFLTTKASEVVHVKFTQWVCPGVPPIMLDYHL